ncbi:MAG TPA: FRG domain-containing protein [Hanamia sp.]|nr:FRG domain-containing protein [Hanamia sp.]
MKAIFYEEIKWQEYLKKFENFNLDSSNSPYIFRGQSNDIDKNQKFIPWNLTSSFNRYYSEWNLSFFEFVNQQLENSIFRSYYSEYLGVTKTQLNSFNALQKLYFLQHYQVPTCLIDFTFNPFIALYFAISSIKGFSGSQYDNLGYPLIYPEDCYASIYQLNCEILKDVGIENIIDKNGAFLYHSDNAKYVFDNRENPIAFLDLNPKSGNEIYNLKKQQGCFLFFDNHNRTHSFEDYLESKISSNSIYLKEPVIIVYKIKWYTVFRNMANTEKTLFKHLKEKGIYGKELFDDLQGLKYDFNFF